jgi:hypothetical protein
VWLSTDGGSTYGNAPIGTITGPGRQGTTTATLAAYGGANPDNVNTLSVDLTESGGVLTSGTASDAANAVTLAYCGGELLSYETVTPTGTYDFNLTTLYRGLYGTSPGSHASGAQFARLDSQTFKYNLPAAYVGSTLYLKFQSFNIFGLEPQDLSTCVAYPITPAGTGFGGGTGGVPLTPTGFTATGAAGAVTTSWSANPVSDNITGYVLSRAAGTGAPFSSAVPIWEGSALSYTDTPLPSSTGYTYFLQAVNMMGDSVHTAGANATTSSSGGGSATGTATTVGAVGGSAPCGYLYSVAGAAKVTVADNATGPPNECNVFVKTSYGGGVTATYYFPGQLITGLSLTPGLTYYLGAGGALATAPGASGTFSQVIGVTDESGNLFFNPGAIGQVS